MNCLRESRCKFIEDCVPEICKYFNEQPEKVLEAKSGRGRKAVKIELSANKIKDVQYAMKILKQKALVGRLDENQIKAIKSYKGKRAKSLGQIECTQVISIYNDSFKDA